MAQVAQALREQVLHAFETSTASASLQELYDIYHATFSHDLQEFADTFGQALASSLLHISQHQRQSARSHPPHAILNPSHPFLSRLFAILLQQPINDDMLNFYTQQFMKLARQLDGHTLSEDDLLHFYEAFLAAYHPQEREKRGVYYTPRPVVSYIVRSIDDLLRSAFACPDGLASRGGKFPMLLDPACGTGIFLQEVVYFLYEIYQQQDKVDLLPEHMQTVFLLRMRGIELLPVPYLLAQLQFESYLASLLPERISWKMPFFHGDVLADPSALEGIFEQSAIPVILGNPPYAGHSPNKQEWLAELLETYKEGCPELKKPAQAKWLSDDYVKFLRLAQEQIDRAGQGILAFVTSHSYLDNPTFRGMRRSLCHSFNEIYILDLHGNNKKLEAAPDARDENIFSIQQGVAISLFVKYPQAGTTSTVHHMHLWGTTEQKLNWLSTHSLHNTAWEALPLQAPTYFLAPQQTHHQDEYEAGWRILDIFCLNGSPAPGIITCHDDFAISWTRTEASEKVQRLLSTQSEDEARQLFRLCSQEQWQYERARQELSEGNWQQALTPILYRPFDIRWTVFDRHVAVHLRERVTRHLRAGENIALAIGKAGQVISQAPWDIALCTRLVTEFNLFRRGGNNLFPLYLYNKNIGRANLSPLFMRTVTAHLQWNWLDAGHGDLEQTIGPEDIFAYIYALLYSPTYRERYAPFLKRDFPRVPLTSNQNLFRSLCILGKQLVKLHLMEQIPATDVDYPVAGENNVEFVRYIPSETDTTTGVVWINTRQYFAPVPHPAWMFHIGGYQVCRKWLKDRKGRMLAEEEIVQYKQLVAIIGETVRLMGEIDKAIRERGGWPI
jgi:predicted helicase